jgi:hypothetical protein
MRKWSGEGSIVSMKLDHGMRCHSQPMKDLAPWLRSFSRLEVHVFYPSTWEADRMIREFPVSKKIKLLHLHLRICLQ